MNARQARRLALWINGHYMLAADHTGLTQDVETRLDADDQERLMSQQAGLGRDMIARSGIAIEATHDEALATVLSRRSATDEPGRKRRA